MAVIIPTTGIGDTTPSVATELIGGVHYQALKLYTGTTGTATVWDELMGIDAMPANAVATGTIQAALSTVTMTLPGGAGTVALQITGTWTGQIDFQGSVDGTNYVSVQASNGTSTVNATAGNGIFILPGGGYVKIRAISTVGLTGPAVCTLVASVGTSASIPTGATPAGTNLIGKVGIDQVTANANEVVVKSLTTGSVAIANTHTYVDVLTTGNIAVANTHTYVDALTTGYVAAHVTTGALMVGQLTTARSLSTGSISAIVANWTTATYVTTGALMVGQLTTARSLSTGSISAVVANWTTATYVTTGSLMVGQLTTARSLSTGSISAVVANWPASQAVTGYTVITTGQVHIPNVVNVTGSLAASFATTAFQVTTGNINIGNVVNVTGTFSGVFDSTNMIVNNITTGQISALIGNWTTAAYITTGSLMVGQLTTARSLSTGSISVIVANWTTATNVTTGALIVDRLTTGNVSADVRNVTTGNISADVRNVTTGNVVVRNLVAGTLTTANVAIANTHTYVDVLTTGNISATVRDVTTGTLHVIPYGDRANYVYGMTTQTVATTATIIITSQGANVGTYITAMLVTNANTTIGTWVSIMNGATTGWMGFAAAGGGGWASTFPTPLPGAANVPWSAKCHTTGAEVRVSMSGYKGAA